MRIFIFMKRKIKDLIVIRKNFYEARLYLIGFKICKDEIEPIFDYLSKKKKIEPIFTTKLHGARVMVI